MSDCPGFPYRTPFNPNPSPNEFSNGTVGTGPSPQPNARNRGGVLYSPSGQTQDSDFCLLVMVVSVVVSSGATKSNTYGHIWLWPKI